MLFGKAKRMVFVGLEVESIVVVQTDHAEGHPSALGDLVSAWQGNSVLGNDFAEKDFRQCRVDAGALADGTVCE